MPFNDTMMAVMPLRATDTLRHPFRQRAVSFHLTANTRCTEMVLKWRQNESATPMQFTVKVTDGKKIQIIPDSAGIPEFDYQIKQTIPDVYTFTVAPKSIEKRATAFLRFKAVASEGEVQRERQLRSFSLVSARMSSCAGKASRTSSDCPCSQ